MADASLQKVGTHEFAAAEQAHGVTLSPRIDILETEQELLLYAELPGVKQENLDIRFDNGELTIHARRSFAGAGRYLFQEVDASDYFRSFRIGEKIDGDRIWAELQRGLLTLHLPKLEAAKPRKITIKN